jgi:tRNA-binding EMAP/Myf-like protein
MVAAGAVLNECFQLIDLYARVSSPFIPTAAEKMRAIFADSHELTWPTQYEHRVKDGAEFSVPENLFNRIDDETVAMLTEKYAPKQDENIPTPIVAEIVDIKNHDTRDDLHILTVNTGADMAQIVCGAPNVRVGLRGVLAPVGAKLPGMKKPMAQRTVAGVESYGMMCSPAELGIGTDDKKIIELGSDYTIGSEYK